METPDLIAGARAGDHDAFRELVELHSHELQEHLGLERGRRTLTITHKGGRVVTIPLAPRTPGRSTWPSGNEPAGRCGRRRPQPPGGQALAATTSRW